MATHSIAGFAVSGGDTLAVGPIRSLALAALLVAVCAAPAVVMAQARAVSPAPAPSAAAANIAPLGSAAKPAGAPIALGAPVQGGGSGAIGAGMRAGQPMPTPKPVQPPSPKIDLVNEQLQANAPMSPAEIARLKTELDRRSQAMTENSSASDPLARPTQSVFNIDLSPKGAYTPPIVRITPGQGAVVTFVDQAGKPWPITVADNAGEEAGISVTQFSPHQLSIFAKNRIAKGNVLVGLKNLTAPVTFTTMTGQKQVDYSVTMIIPRLQEGSVPPNLNPGDSNPSLASSDLFDYLLGTPPARARPLKVTGMSDTQVWQVGGDKMVVRSPVLITGCMRSFKLDDMGVCELPVMPVLLGTWNGRYVQGQVTLN